MRWLFGRTLISLIALLILLPSFLAAGAHENQHWTVVDGIVATINDIPVLRSDIQMEADLGLLEAPDENGGFAGLLDPYLNRLLILNELEDIGGFRLTNGQAEGAYQGYLAGFDDRTVFEEKLRRWGVEEIEVFKRLERALLASIYTESRIKFFVKVIPSDIENAYAENPERWGNVGVFEAWETIKSELMEKSFKREKSRWLASLRERYHLVMFKTDEDSQQ